MSPRRPRSDEERDALELEQAKLKTAQQPPAITLADGISPNWGDDAEAPAPAQKGTVIAQTYVHTTHPDTGVPVVFIPGEALPAWAVPAAEGHAVAHARIQHTTG